MKHVSILLSVLFVSFNLFAQEPATEIRAAWLTTNWALDWPQQGKTSKEQKKDLERILDELQKDNFNVVLFQARAQGKVFYKSLLEEQSPYFNKSDNFDPLAFAIEACHARGMECHAWITTFPAERAKTSKKGTLAEKKPDFYKLDGKHWFLDPGHPQARNRLVLIAKEIVTKYDVDGLHLDYIRYPDNPKTFKDDDTYRLYGKGQNKEQWRRENINKTVFQIYDAIKAIKNWVQVSSAPIGKYKALKAKDGWTAYESVLQDAGHWMQEGKQDLLFPMMYTKGNEFYPYVGAWLAERNHRHIVPGIGVYQLEEAEKDWDIKEIPDQIQFTRKEHAQGQAYFRVGQILNNKKGVRNSIRKFYKYPAKLPPMPWLSATTPSDPQQFEVFKDQEGLLHIQWRRSDAKDRYTYNIYFSASESLDMSNAEGILATNLHANHYTFPAAVGEFAFYYFVTATDRYHNESRPSESVIFVHSKDVY